MKTRKNDYFSLQEGLKEFVEHSRLEEGLDRVRAKQAWNTVMGPMVEKYTTSISYKNKTLVVELSSSVLRQELTYGIQKIIVLLNEELEKELVEKLVLK